MHLWTGKVLRDFLASEPEWQIIDEWSDRTTAFRKRAEAPYRDWFDQSFVLRRSTPTISRARMTAALLRRGDVRTLWQLIVRVFRRS